MVVKMIYKSIRHHALSSFIACISVAIAIALLTSVTSVRNQTHDNFTKVGLGVDAILGPKGSSLQIVLNALYHLEEMPGKIPWTYMQKVADDKIVEKIIPFCTGHSFAGVRVNAIEPEFFTEFEYSPGKKFTFEAASGGSGRIFKDTNEAVCGYQAALELKMNIGSTFNPVCGVKQGDPVHNNVIKVSGIMAPTGTPYDRAIYIPLKSFYTLSGHGIETAAMALSEEHREISGAYIKLRHILGGAVHPGIQDLKYNINQSAKAQFIVPNEVLPRLFNIIGWVDSVLSAVSIMVGIMALMFLFTVLLNAAYSRRRDIALIRFLGATRNIVFAAAIGESLFITAFGTLIGAAAGHMIIHFVSIYIGAETGVKIYASVFFIEELYIAAVTLLAGAAAGLIPAINSYRIDIIKNLRPLS